mgnify:CR=1 FL=1
MKDSVYNTLKALICINLTNTSNHCKHSLNRPSALQFPARLPKLLSRSAVTDGKKSSNFRARAVEMLISPEKNADYMDMEKFGLRLNSCKVFRSF